LAFTREQHEHSQQRHLQKHSPEGTAATFDSLTLMYVSEDVVSRTNQGFGGGAVSKKNSGAKNRSSQ